MASDFTQETGSWLREVLLVQLRVELLPVVLLGWRALRICQLPDVRVESVEANVRYKLHLFRSQEFVVWKLV